MAYNNPDASYFKRQNKRTFFRLRISNITTFSVCVIKTDPNIKTLKRLLFTFLQAFVIRISLILNEYYLYVLSFIESTLPVSNENIL